MGILTKDEILKIQDLQMEKLSIPEWGGDVFVRGLTGVERGEYDLAMLGEDMKADAGKYPTLRARLVALATCNEEGERLFSDDDVRELAKKSSLALERIFKKAQRLSGLNLREVKDLAKN